MSFASAYVLYNGTSGSYVGDQAVQIQMDCTRFRAYSPRQCWLKRRLMPGDGTQIQHLLTFNGSDPEIDSNTLVGFMVENDGQDTMIDIVSAAALVTACNCPDCVSGTGNPVARNYPYGVPTFTAPVGLFYCVTRADDGSGYSVDKFVTDYVTGYIGNIRVKSNVSGVSVYTFQSFYTLAQLQAIAVGTDVIAQC
jgi:hypothetical protein